MVLFFKMTKIQCSKCWKHN